VHGFTKNQNKRLFDQNGWIGDEKVRKRKVEDG
jgi:hypothetical protein